MKVILLIISILFLSGCGHDPYKIPDEVVIDLNENIFEVFDDLEVKDFIKNSNVEIENKSITNESIGKKKYTLEFNYDGEYYKKDIEYQVIDTVKPVFISSYGSTTILVNQDINPCEDAVYADNYDTDLTCVIDGFYDTSVVGNYEVYYSLKDTSNNETRKKLKINVVDKLKQNSNKGNGGSKDSSINVKDLILKHKNDNTMIGIDVSRWQGDIDYEKVKADGVEFVIMRMGVNSAAKGELSMDSYYLKNIENAKKAGLKVGVYLYSTATNKLKAYDHAMWVVENLNGMELDFPIAYDWENWEWYMEYEMSIHTLSECFNVFAKTLKEHGYDAMLYSSKFYLENIWMNKHNYPVWLAHYTSNTDYKGDYIMWQLTAKGKVNGITGDVDLNIYYKEKTS